MNFIYNIISNPGKTEINVNVKITNNKILGKVRAKYKVNPNLTAAGFVN